LRWCRIEVAATPMGLLKAPLVRLQTFESFHFRFAKAPTKGASPAGAETRSSASRFTAEQAGFFILSQSGERPERYERWGWSITVIVPASPGVTNGTAATLAETEAKFRASWDQRRIGAARRSMDQRAAVHARTVPVWCPGDVELTNPKCVRGSGATLQPSEARACTQSATIPKPGPLLALAPEDMRELSWTEASCAVERAEKWVLFPARVQHEAPPPPSSKFPLKPLRCRLSARRQGKWGVVLLAIRKEPWNQRAACCGRSWVSR
jgi:hypothetical protein